MALMSPEYIALNAALHAEHVDYGTGSFRWSEMIVNLREELGAETVLDYGCGKGGLRHALGKPEWLAEYDPAIPGKHEPPTGQFDLVVCTDVLEHVEPENIDDVLEHLRRITKKALFIVISTRPSTKTLADGRNAHLLLEDKDQWRQRLGRYFDIVSWDSPTDEIIAVLKRFYTLGDLKVISAVSETIRFEQASRNIGLVHRRLDLKSRHEGRVAIVGFGPSLRQTWPQIAEEQKRGMPVVSMSGAHDYLIERGIIPDIHIDCDPRPHKAFFTRNPHPKVKYWMASCCHPDTIDQLMGYDLTLWHVYNSDEDVRIVHELDRNGFLVCGGGSVGCRAVNVLFTQGYRQYSLYGFDCSFADDDAQHAGQHSGKHQKALRARCGDRWFKTSGTMIAIARSFIIAMDFLDKGCKQAGEPTPYDGDCIATWIHGDGLLPAMIRSGQDDVAVSVPPEALGDYTKEAAEAA